MASYEETDLSGLDPAEARQYVTAYIQSLKETERQRRKQEEELGLWRNRAKLASVQGQPDLAEQAASRAQEIQGQVDRLVAEERDLKTKVGILKEKLQGVGHRFEPSVNSELLLAGIDLLAGERDETEERIRETEADAALDALKRRLEGE